MASRYLLLATVSLLAAPAVGQTARQHYPFSETPEGDSVLAVVALPPSSYRFDRAEITFAGLSEVDRRAAELQGLRGPGKVVVVGLTGMSGPVKFNQALALARAIKVARRLAEKGAPAHLLYALSDPSLDPLPGIAEHKTPDRISNPKASMVVIRRRTDVGENPSP